MTARKSLGRSTVVVTFINIPDSVNPSRKGLEREMGLEPPHSPLFHSGER